MRNTIQKGAKTLLKTCAALALCLTMTQTSPAQKLDGTTEAQSLEVQSNDSQVKPEGATKNITIRIYPNPCMDFVTVIANGNAQILVFNHEMRKIVVPMTTSISGDNRLDFSNYPTGLYYISVTTRDGSTTEKLYKN